MIPPIFNFFKIPFPSFGGLLYNCCATHALRFARITPRFTPICHSLITTISFCCCFWLLGQIYRSSLYFLSIICIGLCPESVALASAFLILFCFTDLRPGLAWAIQAFGKLVRSLTRLSSIYLFTISVCRLSYSNLDFFSLDALCSLISS